MKFEFFSERVRDKDLDKDAEGSEQCFLLEELKYHPLYQFNRKVEIHFHRKVEIHFPAILSLILESVYLVDLLKYKYNSASQ